MVEEFYPKLLRCLGEMGTSHKSRVDLTEASGRTMTCHVLPSSKYNMLFRTWRKSPRWIQSIQCNLKANQKKKPCSCFKRKALSIRLNLPWVNRSTAQGAKIFYRTVDEPQMNWTKWAICGSLCPVMILSESSAWQLEDLLCQMVCSPTGIRW